MIVTYSRRDAKNFLEQYSNKYSHCRPLNKQATTGLTILHYHKRNNTCLLKYFDYATGYFKAFLLTPLNFTSIDSDTYSNLYFEWNKDTSSSLKYKSLW